MSEFQIHKNLFLRLENGKTNIYINNQKFIHCKFLLLSVNIEELKSLNEIESIDEAAEKLDKSLETYDTKKAINIDPETEFWAHCSNLQVWYENNYNSKLLHRNLAFPLLKRLTEVGDPIAKKVFKEEIARRFSSGVHSVMLYLMNEGYITFLNKEEFETVLDTMPNIFSELRQCLEMKKSESVEDFLGSFINMLKADTSLLEDLVLNPKLKLIKNLLLVISTWPISDVEIIDMILDIFDTLKTINNDEILKNVRDEVIYQFHNGSSRILKELIIDKFFIFLDDFSLKSVLSNVKFIENLYSLIENDPKYILDGLIELIKMIYDKIGEVSVLNLIKTMPTSTKFKLKNELKERLIWYATRKDLYPEKREDLIQTASNLLQVIKISKDFLREIK